MREAYLQWIQAFDTLSAEANGRLRQAIGELSVKPLFSVVTGEGEAARKALETQAYEHWEVVAHPSQARGEYLLFLEPGDALAEYALYCFAEAFCRNPGLKLAYGGHDYKDAAGKRHTPCFTGAWNPDLLYALDYVSPAACYSRKALEDAGCLEPHAPAGAEGYARVLALSAVLTHAEVAHIPHIVLHRRGEVFAYAAVMRRPELKAARDAFMRKEKPACRIRYTPDDIPHILYPLPEPAPEVTLFIPTRDGGAALATCIASVREKTAYPNYRIVVIDNQSREPATLDFLAGLEAQGAIRILRYDAPFNYAAMHNWAVKQCESPLICFLNDDTEVVNAGWLQEMAAHALRPGVGAVGAKLLFEGGALQHAGVILGVTGVASHYFYRMPDKQAGYWLRAHLTQQVSAVTAACMVLRREVFQQVGGFEEQLSVLYNDVDLCLRLWEQGLSVVYTPFARLVHHQNVSRGVDVTPEKRERLMRETAFMHKRWGAQLADDPFYNPNLDIRLGSFAPAAPRVAAPWLPAQRAARVQPVVVMGMHRSGTGAVAEVLEKLGVFMGDVKDENHEAVFFLGLHETLLHAAGASWDAPLKLEQKLKDPQFFAQCRETLRRALESDTALSYLGRAHKDVFAIPIPWGWKDPRSAFTIALWQEFFPDLKAVHVVRHGVDVAESLKRRGEKGSIRRTDQCSTLEGGFALWIAYLAAGARAVSALGHRALQLRYETLLQFPEEEIRSLAAFCGIEADAKTLKASARRLEKEKGYKYRAKPELAAFAHARRHILRRAGYFMEEAPVVIGGTGGSGTRAVQSVMEAAGLWMGGNLNISKDAMDFEPFLDATINRVLEHTRSLDYALGDLPRPLAHEVTERLRSDAMRFITGLPENALHWGWKNPRSMYVLPIIHALFPEMRFVHVTRDGRDMAFSSNQNQLRKHYAALFGKEPEDTPRNSLMLWAKANADAAAWGEHTLGERYIHLSFERLCANPEREIALLLEKLGMQSAKPLKELAALVQAPGSIGRHMQKGAGMATLPVGAGQALKRFGYG